MEDLSKAKLLGNEYQATDDVVLTTDYVKVYQSLDYIQNTDFVEVEGIAIEGDSHYTAFEIENDSKVVIKNGIGQIESIYQYHDGNWYEL